MQAHGRPTGTSQPRPTGRLTTSPPLAFGIAGEGVVTTTFKLLPFNHHTPMDRRSSFGSDATAKQGPGWPIGVPPYTGVGSAEACMGLPWADSVSACP